MITGGCLCGAVRYEAAGAPLYAGFCHCRDCQRATGTGHSCYMAFLREAVTLRGKTRAYASGPVGGRRGVRHFCPVCGSARVGEPGSAPETINLYAGTLDDPSLFRPTAAIFVRSRPEWDRPAVVLEEFVGHPADGTETETG